MGGVCLLDSYKKRILIAPLDWGLGHATRCIPIIRYLLQKSCEVIIGADGRPLQLLKKEFPSLDFIVIPGYNITYPKTGTMTLKIMSQIPKFVSGIKSEHELLKKIIIEKQLDAVISDNRFGLWSKTIPCVFITHQLMVKAPFGEKLIHQLNKNYISKYSECWVPDMKNGLSGDLGNKFELSKNTKHIGLLSRFDTPPNQLSRGGMRELLVILSGPEPQRTIFENKIIEQISTLQKKSLIVQGITEKNERRKISEHTEIVSYLTSDELQKKIISSKIILSRPGYSTVMDLAVLEKKAIFVPTPGQTEQEYLAQYFSKKKIAYSVSQKKFDLSIALKYSESYSGFTEKYSSEEFKKAIDGFINRESNKYTK